MRVVFMGTPEFAVPSLAELIKGPDEVIAVVTQPDRPSGRHSTPIPSPVKRLALQHHIPVYQPDKIKDPGFFSILQGLKPDIIVVVAYGQILSDKILDLPPMKCINIHASLLPKYRGSSPVNWAILKGEKVTGATSMMIAKGLDSGPILLKKEVSIDHDDDAGTLLNKLSTVGGKVLAETMEGLKKGILATIPQIESEATYFPMLKKTDGLINWAEGAEDIRNRVRGLHPWPGAYTFLRGSMLKLFKTEVAYSKDPEGMPGTILGAGEEGISVAAGSDILVIKEIQPEGGRRMTAGEFIRGHRIKTGEVLGS